MARGNSPRRPNARDGKPPAFQLYVADWLTSQTTRCMSHAERGAYIDLLCYAWRDGSIPADPDRIARLVGVDPITLAEWWLTIGPCWKPSETEPDRLVNPRQEFERVTIMEYREAKSRAGKLGAEATHRPKIQPSAGGATILPVANPASTSSIASTSTKEKKKNRLALAREILSKMNDRRVEIGLRRLTLTDGNLKPIVARLADYNEETILRAWNGASRDEWVVSNHKLLPAHVLRPTTIEGYIDAGTPRSNTVPVHVPPGTVMVEWECGECRRITMVEMPIRKARDKPDGYLCGGCTDRRAQAKEIADRGDRPQGITEILEQIRP